MFFQTLANETKESNIKVLNYAPGPCDTKMVDDLLSNSRLDKGIKESFHEMKINGKLVQPDDTADCLANIIMNGDFTSGQHIDYYDVCNKY